MTHSQHPDTALPSPAYTSTIADGRAEILKELAKTDAVTHAISVALLDDRRVLWEEAFGLIDRTRNLRPNPETLFCIASRPDPLPARLFQWAAKVLFKSIPTTSVCSFRQAISAWPA